MNLSYDEIERRAWEANVYYGVGYVVIGSMLEETDRGYKGEDREASAAEMDMFEVIKEMTPSIKTIPIDDSIDLWTANDEDLSKLIKEYVSSSRKISFIGERCLWLENKNNSVLCKNDGDGVSWSKKYCQLVTF